MIVDLTQYREDRGIDLTQREDTLSWSWAGKDYWIGVECMIQAPGKDDGEPTIDVVGRFFWPIATYEDAEGQARGTVIQYVTRTGEVKSFLLPASSSGSTQAASKAAEHAAAQGVQLSYQRARSFCELVHSYVECHRLPNFKMVRRPGWHEVDKQKVYVNGEYIMPAGRRICADRSSSVIINRSCRAGGLSGQIGAIKEEVTTPGLRAALGVSLAGPLVQMLGMDSFGVHFHAQTSVGKTTASAVAASVWGSEAKIKQSFNTTQNGLEAAAEQANGACLVMDELGQFRGGPMQLGNAIYDLMSQQGRLRLTQTGEQRQRREWGFSMISNGEISVMDMVGDGLKGGQMVRLMDVEIEKGELTIDSAHAARIKSRFWGSAIKPGNYGHVGDQWAHYLTSIDTAAVHAEWEIVRRTLGDEFSGANAEVERMLNAIAIVGAALIQATRAKIIKWPENESMDVARWIARKVIGARRADGVDTPEERLLRRWHELILTEPAKFPKDNDERKPPVVYGYFYGAEVWTTETMINKSGLPQAVGVSARRFLAWALKNGIFTESGERETAGGVRQRWKKYHFDRE
jgi:hypothetical protein